MENWNIKSSVFDSIEENEKILVVIKDILKELDKLIPAGPILGFKKIELINDKVSGPTFYWPQEMDYYKIALNLTGLNYNQIAFQFSQNICRAYCDPKITSWFIQLFNHIFALYTLDFLREKWEGSPPNAELKDYWNNFDTYKSNLLSAAFSKVDIVKYQVANEWVQYQINKLRRNNKANRGKLLIIANELLPMFKDHPEGWRILPYIGKSIKNKAPLVSGVSINEKYNEPDFELLIENLPIELHDFTDKFYHKIGVLKYN